MVSRDIFEPAWPFRDKRVTERKLEIYAKSSALWGLSDNVLVEAQILENSYICPVHL